jgi:23S rRNA pseudouridine1911/1915/1917 synthase
MKLSILYEDNHVIAAEKPAGILSQGDSSGRTSMLDAVREYIRKKYGKQGRAFLGLVHRLDRQVSGVMVFARTSKAARRLSGEFSGRRAVKVYCALVHAPGATGRGATAAPGEWITVTQHLEREGSTTRVSSRGDGRSMKASLSYRVLWSGKDHRMLLVRLITGRKHQIRAQLSQGGMPVVGDTKYGSPEPLADGAICLHACYLLIAHPTLKIPLELFSEPPPRIMERTVLSKDVLLAAARDAGAR